VRSPARPAPAITTRSTCTSTYVSGADGVRVARRARPAAAARRRFPRSSPSVTRRVLNQVLALKFLATPRIEPMDTTLARPPIGQLLDGRYRVESLIARGGMATVYLGTDTRLERTVALKIMHAELANDEDFVRRFVSEARSIAQLSHPNVVTVYDQGAGRPQPVPGDGVRARPDAPRPAELAWPARPA
jgi:hypothetical protein